MEPLFYNVNISGEWGARIADATDYIRDARDDPRHTSKLLRVSPERAAAAAKFLQLTQAMAAIGVTHVYHLILGWERGQKLRFMSYRELAHMAQAKAGTSPPILLAKSSCTGALSACHMQKKRPRQSLRSSSSSSEPPSVELARDASQLCRFFMARRRLFASFAARERANVLVFMIPVRIAGYRFFGPPYRAHIKI